ncbi:hypothetical protein N665_0120s0027 [Sinapis alba]|nr:hypothetical protein N665_0120s0027 [Sinapis alba]
MDRLSLLPDELIFKILFFLPSQFAVITTSLLSKRWCSLWKHVPNLRYFDQHSESEYWRASRFIDKFLLLQDNAHALETVHLYVNQFGPLTDIETWLGVAVSRGVRNLIFYQYSSTIWYQPIRLPKSMYTCETLVTLSLRHAFIVDVPLNICFTSLKSLSLEFVSFLSDDDIVHRLLSGCRVLEELNVVRCGYYKVKTFKIMVPTLQRLTVYDCSPYGNPVPGHDVGFVIQTPCLKSLTITSQFGWFHSLVKMPYLVKAYIKLQHGDSKNLLGCVTSVKHLFLCVKQRKDSYPIGDFSQLVSLKVCTCSLDWYRLILTRAPKLRVLRFQGQANLPPSQYINDLHKCYRSSGDVQTQWEPPSSVPECLISSLEIIEWNDTKGTEAENSEMKYLKENSRQLKMMATTKYR